MPNKNTALTDIQKYELCLYAHNNKKTRTQYVDWIEQKWGFRVNESTITWILQSKEKQLTTEITKSEAKHHKPVTVPVLELALKEFVLCYQHKTILSDAILIEKAKILASELEVPQGMLQFSKGWLQKFKEHSANENAIAEALLLLQNKCAEYPPDRIYNMDETGLFYRLESDRILATKSNAKAWILTTLFQEWLQEFNYQVSIKHNKQRILLLLDNCKSYKIDTLVLENVEVCFLLPNTTSKLQPMDSGIIMSFKKHYRYHHIK
uniref:HTH CENPB-type domain-containing protein n=1 Tax=Rhizophagus irregularis (strain DAOM 181602 / DAOM 197198 / MUCL 43194) TaxID=747089 RepID=U9SWB4_RHIID